MRIKRTRLAILLLTVVMLSGVLFLTQTPVFAQISQLANQQIPEVEVRDLDIERTAIYEIEGITFLLSRHNLESVGDLVAYRELQNQRLGVLGGTDPRFARVTFKLPLSLASVEEILAGVTIGSLRYVSSPEGGGQLPHPVDEDTMAALLQWEEDLKEHLGEDFQIVVGFTAAEVFAPPDRLREIVEDPRVFVVDAGSIDLLSQFVNAFTLSENDTAFRYERFVGSVCSLDALISLTDNFREEGFIDNAGIHNSIRSKLENAKRQLDRRRVNAAVNMVEAVIHEIETQRDKHVEMGAADQLIIIADCIVIRLIEA